jgi:hypothetical protein
MGDAGQRWRGGGEARTGERGDERVGATERGDVLFLRLGGCNQT